SRSHYVILLSSYDAFLFLCLILHRLYSVPRSFSVIRPPPTSTLFPYTTLFRSVSLPAQRSASAAISASARAAPRWTAADLDGHRDRKSTRLNSSHGSISYAVFCLKKKKTKIVQAH